MRPVDYSRGETIMNKLIALIPVLLAFASTTVVADSMDQDNNGHGRKTILSFRTMYGVDGPFVGDANPVRDVIGDELPWVVNGSVRGELDNRGHLTIFVRGLVFADEPQVPPELV